MMTIFLRARRLRAGIRIAAILPLLAAALAAFAGAQTDCADSSSPVDVAPPKTMTVEQLIQRFTAGETRAKEARSHYAYTQDLLVQTLSDKAVNGQFHEITKVSYDDKGKRLDNVTFAEQPTLRDVQLSAQDRNDIVEFMPWFLTSEQLPQYKLTYAGQQHVDDLDTYVFQVEPLKLEKDKRYFQGKVWVDDRDLQVVKLCGKSVPEVQVKKKQPVEIRPTFVSYRQIIDGNWFPVYARVDETLHFQVQVVDVREIVKFTGYKRVGSNATASKP